MPASPARGCDTTASSPPSFSTGSRASGMSTTSASASGGMKSTRRSAPSTKQPRLPSAGPCSRRHARGWRRRSRTSRASGARRSLTTSPSLTKTRPRRKVRRRNPRRRRRRPRRFRLPRSTRRFPKTEGDATRTEAPLPMDDSAAENDTDSGDDDGRLRRRSQTRGD